MHGTIPASSLPSTVECPVCHQQVAVGFCGEVIGWHLVSDKGRRKGCPGEGSPVPRPEPLEVSR